METDLTNEGDPECENLDDTGTGSGAGCGPGQVYDPKIEKCTDLGEEIVVCAPPMVRDPSSPTGCFEPYDPEPGRDPEPTGDPGSKEPDSDASGPMTDCPVNEEGVQLVPNPKEGGCECPIRTSVSGSSDCIPDEEESQCIGLETLGTSNPNSPLAPASNVPLEPGNGGRSIGISALKMGDIILSTTNNPISKGIRGATDSPVSHTILYVGDGMVVEAVMGGVRLVPLEKALSDATFAVALRHPGLTHDQALQIRDFAGKQLKKGLTLTNYDFQYGIIKQAKFRLDMATMELIVETLCPDMDPKTKDLLVKDLLPTLLASINLGTRTNDSWFCSELVIAAYDAAGVPLTSTPPHWTAPGDIIPIRSNGALEYVGHIKTKLLADENVGDDDNENEHGSSQATNDPVVRTPSAGDIVKGWISSEQGCLYDSASGVCMDDEWLPPSLSPQEGSDDESVMRVPPAQEEQVTTEEEEVVIEDQEDKRTGCDVDPEECADDFDECSGEDMVLVNGVDCVPTTASSSDETNEDGIQKGEEFLLDENPQAAESSGSQNTVVMPLGSSAATSGVGYDPDPITVSPGASVTWDNQDNVLHTATSGNPDTATPDGTFDTGLVGANQQSKPVTMPTEPGEYTYFCSLHPFLVGTVTVQ
jgi:plastocyanin